VPAASMVSTAFRTSSLLDIASEMVIFTLALRLQELGPSGVTVHVLVRRSMKGGMFSASTV